MLIKRTKVLISPFKYQPKFMDRIQFLKRNDLLSFLKRCFDLIYLLYTNTSMSSTAVDHQLVEVPFKFYLS